MANAFHAVASFRLVTPPNEALIRPRFGRQNCIHMAPFSRATAPPPPGASDRSRQMLQSLDVRGTPALTAPNPACEHARRLSTLACTLTFLRPNPRHRRHRRSICWLRPARMLIPSLLPTDASDARAARVCDPLFTRHLPTMFSRERMRGLIGARATRASFAARGHAPDGTPTGLCRSLPSRDW
jgi:hypothetical protein